MEERQRIIKKLFAIWDKKAGRILTPLIIVTQKGEALRELDGLVTRGKDNLVALYPADYCLMLLGEMDELSGDIYPQTRPEIVAEAMDYKVNKAD
jgi:hypothetical protein